MYSDRAYAVALFCISMRRFLPAAARYAPILLCAVFPRGARKHRTQINNEGARCRRLDAPTAQVLYSIARQCLEDTLQRVEKILTNGTAAKQSGEEFKSAQRLVIVESRVRL